METTGGTDGQGSNNKRQLFSEPTRVDIDAIDTDINARPGDAELTPWLHSLLFVRDTEAECCHVGGLLPYMIRIACSLSSRLMAALSGAAATAGAAGSSTPVGSAQFGRRGFFSSTRKFGRRRK